MPDVAPVAAFAAPSAAPLVAAAPRRSVALDAGAPNPSRWWHLLPGSLLPLVLFGMFIVHDVWVKRPSTPLPVLSEKPLDPKPYLLIHFHDQLVPFHDQPVDFDEIRDTVYKDVGPTMRFGLVGLVEAPEASNDPNKKVLRQKRLTYDLKGRSNNTCILLDGSEDIFGHPPGQWLERSTSLGKDAQGNEHGRGSIWSYPDQRVRVTQSVEVVRGQSSGLLDTCLVRYTIENNDTRLHKVGLRFMLDTYIGDRDGVPFLLPGVSGLNDTMKDFSTAKEVPNFIQALEFDDLNNPGTVAHVQSADERPGVPRRVTRAWPNPDLEKLPGLAEAYKGKFQQHLTKWDVPVLSMQSIQKVPKDSDKPKCRRTPVW